MRLLETILLIVLVYYLFKMIMRLFIPFLLRHFASKMQDRFEQQFNQQYQDQPSKPKEEGKVTIEKTKTSSQSRSKNVGEYVDFEEVNE